jgi:tetratricopeptide (TPR) repeat protein
MSMQGVAGAAHFEFAGVRVTEVQGGDAMYRMILGAAAALAVAIAVRPAGADDLSVTCLNERGDAKIGACGRLLALTPSREAYYKRGRAFLGAGEYDRAISDFDQAIRISPKFAAAYNRRGDAFEAKNDPRHAIADFDQALQLDPSLLSARQGRERVQRVLAQRSGAPTNASAGTAAVPPPAPAHAFGQSSGAPPHQPLLPGPGLGRNATPSQPSADLAECLNRADKNAQRRADACTRAIEANPGNNSVLLPAHMARSNMNQELKQWDHVIADCDEVLRLAPPGEARSAAEGLRRVAVMIVQRSNPGAPSNAPASTATAAPSAPVQSATPSADISECSNLGDDVRRRLDACTRVIAANPANNRVLLPAYMARSSLYTQLKQWDRVVADCDEVLRLDPPGEARATTDGLRRAALAMMQRSNPGAPTNPPAGAATAAPSAPAQSTQPPADLARCMNDADEDAPRRLEACTRTIEINTGNNEVVLPAHMARAILYQKLKQWDRVIADCDEVLRSAPEGEMRSAADILRGVAVGVQQSKSHAPASAAAAAPPGPAQSPNSSADVAACANQNLKDEAIAACNRLLALNPKDAAAYRNRGSAYSLSGDHNQAIADYDQALRLDPKSAGTGTQFGLAATYYGRAVAYAGKFDFDHSIADLDQAIQLEPKNVLFYTSRGSTYGNKGDYERAIADFDQATRLDPKSAEHPNWGAAFLGVAAVAYDHRGEAYEAKNDPDHALADFDQALKFDPSLASARQGRERMAALLAQRAKPRPTTDFEECKNQGDEVPRRLEACSGVIDANSRSKTELMLAHILRASLYATLRQWDRVVADADAALRFNPPLAFSAPLYGLRGGALRQLHEYDRALADLDKSISPSNPLLADDYWGRGYVYLNMANYERARADLDKAISLKPSSTAYRIRAELRLEQDDNAGALADLNEGLRLDPQDADSYAVRAEYYLRTGKLKEAQADADKAMGIRPDGAFVHATRGWIALEQGRIEVALGELTEAIDIEPGAASVAHRGMAYERSGRPDRAIADYRRALELPPSSRMGREAQGTARQRIAALANAPITPPAVPVPALPPGRRIALVIGMGAYANVGALRNPVSDARAIADVFRHLGFAEVIEREDLTRAKLEEALKDFGDKAADADWAIIYYAGHGIEMNGENYLVPVDAKITRPEHVEDEAVTLKRVLAKTEAAHKLRMVILDACRNNPFRMADGGSRGIGRGLLPVEPARGVMVAYAARDGTTADDGNSGHSGHSPYTQALLANLETPDIDIRIMFSKVRDQVLARTNNAQEPFTYGSLPGEEFYFKAATR